METNITVTPEEVAENMKDVIVRTVVEFGKPCTYVTVRMKKRKEHDAFRRKFLMCAHVGDCIVEQDDGSWRVEKGGKE